jgi:predicted DNA-binding transcriptional regulator AlpA
MPDQSINALVRPVLEPENPREQLASTHRHRQTLAPAVLTYAAAAVYLGLPSANALRQMARRGKAPPSIKFGKRDRRFIVAEIDQWLAAKSRVVKEEAPPAPPRRRGRPTKAEAIARREGYYIYSANLVRSG